MFTVTPIVNEVLNLRREPGNPFSMFAIAVTKDVEVVGHVPKAIERVFSLFLAREGNGGSCTITGMHVNCGVGLGIEVPCVYRLYGQEKYVQRLKELLSKD